MLKHFSSLCRASKKIRMLFHDETCNEMHRKTCVFHVSVVKRRSNIHCIQYM